jgi:glycosyltransferase involved in cell wall biosynthesis
MSNEAHHISVCVCTYKRPQPLKHLLEELRSQDTGGAFSYSIVVVDNDQSRSAEPVVAEFAASSTVPIKYCTESQQNIPLARNKAIENAEGDLIAFIDDDEFPIKRWLLTLLEALNKYGADGVLGPVKPYFENEPPKWVVQGKFYDRPSYSTGFVIDWRKGRTGNVLLKRALFSNSTQRFNPAFRTGEDQDFFRRQIEKGHVFVWCHEAMAYEIVPPARWNWSFMLRRALLQGAASRLHPTFGVREIAISLIAIPVWAIALPFSLVLGHGRFMSPLVRLFNHLGRLLAFLGINPVGEPYVTN